MTGFAPPRLFEVDDDGRVSEMVDLPFIGRFTTKMISDHVSHIPPLTPESVASALRAVRDEIQRQDDLARQGKFGGTHIMPGGTDLERLGVLAEEFGEVAIELNEASIAGVPRTENLRKELTQVAAVSTAWIAVIDEGRSA